MAIGQSVCRGGGGGCNESVLAPALQCYLGKVHLAVTVSEDGCERTRGSPSSVVVRGRRGSERSRKSQAGSEQELINIIDRSHVQSRTWLRVIAAKASPPKVSRRYMCDCCMYHDRLIHHLPRGMHLKPYAVCLLAHAISRLESLLTSLPSHRRQESHHWTLPPSPPPGDMPADAVVSQRLEWL